MLNFADVHLNYLAILVAALLYMIIGFVWYNPNVFGKIWLDALGYKESECDASWKTFAGAFIGALITSFVLALFIHYLNARTLSEGACVGFWAWLGFVLPGHLGGVLWDKKPWKVFFIHTGCMLVTLVLMGALLGFWQ